MRRIRGRKIHQRADSSPALPIREGAVSFAVCLLFIDLYILVGDYSLPDREGGGRVLGMEGPFTYQA
jgi:hypothetical protein